MRKLILWFYRLLLITLGVFGITLFLFTTSPGMKLNSYIVSIFIPGKIRINGFQGNLLSHFSFEHILYTHEGITLQIDKGIVKWRWHYASKQTNIELLKADTISIYLKKTQAQESPGQIKIPFTLFVQQAVINQTEFQNDQQKISIPHLSTSITLNQTHLNIHFLKLQNPETTLNVKGNLEINAPHHISVHSHFTSKAIPQYALNGHLVIEGNQSSYQIKGRLVKPFKGLLDGEISEPNHSFLNFKSTNHEPQLKVSVDKISEDWLGTLSIGNNQIIAKGKSSFPWRLKFTLNQPSLLHDKLKGLKTTIHGEIDLVKSLAGKGKIVLEPGEYQTPEGSTLTFGKSKFEFNFSENHFKGNGILLLEPQMPVDFNIMLPLQFPFNPDKQPFKAEAKLKLHHFEFVKKAIPQIDHITGKVNLNVSAEGTLTKPQVKGTIAIQQADITLPKLGLSLSPVNLKLQSSGSHWIADGTIPINGKAIQINSKGILKPKLNGTLMINGDSVPVIDSAEYHILLSPKLKVILNEKSMHLGGEILIPEALLKPVSFSNSRSLSSDAIFVTEEKSSEDPIPFPLTMNIQLIAGNKVSLDVKGLKGLLGGTIRIEKALNQSPHAIGELAMREGSYKAYGQNLNIDEGRLIFTGSAILNPGLQIRASRIVSLKQNYAGTSQLFNFNLENLESIDLGDKVTVGVQISGKLNAHKITLFSIPGSLSQADILSFLLLGKPASQASHSGAQLLLTAVSSMDLDSGTKGLQLVDQLKQQLGVDFDMETTPQYNYQTNQFDERTSVVLSKNLSKRLQVSYNIGLLDEDNNVITLKYLLNKYFSFQVSTSDSGSGFDLFYTRRKDNFSLDISP